MLAVTANVSNVSLRLKGNDERTKDVHKSIHLSEKKVQSGSADPSLH